jgi:hypothetical protein
MTLCSPEDELEFPLGNDYMLELRGPFFAGPLRQTQAVKMLASGE